MSLPNKPTTEVSEMSSESVSEETVSGSTSAGTGVEAGASHRSAGAESTSDIGQAEAYIVQTKRLGPGPAATGDSGCRGQGCC